MRSSMLTKHTEVTFTLDVSQTIILFTLNLYSDICQLYLSKSKKINIFLVIQYYSCCFHLYSRE